MGPLISLRFEWGWAWATLLDLGITHHMGLRAPCAGDETQAPTRTFLHSLPACLSVLADLHPTLGPSPPPCSLSCGRARSSAFPVKTCGLKVVSLFVCKLFIFLYDKAILYITRYIFTQVGLSFINFFLNKVLFLIVKKETCILQKGLLRHSRNGSALRRCSC